MVTTDFEVFEECGLDGFGIRLARVFDLPTDSCAKALATLRVTMPASNVLLDDVLGNGIVH